MTIDAPLRTLAQSQSGMFTTAQAAAYGIGLEALAALVRSGAIRHPGRGLYAVTAQVDEEPEPWHRHLCAGALLVYPDAVLTGVSAVLAHGLPVWSTDLTRPNLLRPVDRAIGVRAFRIRPGRGTSVETPLGPAVPVAEALVQHALDNGMAQGVVSADAALHSEMVTLAELDAAVVAVASWPRAGRAKSMITFVDGRSESVGESRSRLALTIGGVEVVPQVTITDRHGEFVARVDFVVAGTKIVNEFDGKVKYESGDPEVLWREKKREDQLRRLGYVVVRITWADLERPGAVVARVRAALAAA
jgi:very-short-patch-repair endonuclease